MSKSPAIIAAAVSLALATPAAAQSGFLKSLARQAAAAAIQNAAQPSREQAAPAADSPEAGGEQPAQYAAAEQASVTAGPAPWPNNVGSRAVKYPGNLTFSAELEAQKKAFLEFSKVSCNDCEGGYSYDAWAQHFIRLDGSYNAWEKKLGSLAMGEALGWKGSKSTGVITVVGEEPVNGWRCKQLKWELKRPGASAERPGLICSAKASSYSATESWTIVF